MEEQHGVTELEEPEPFSCFWSITNFNTLAVDWKNELLSPIFNNGNHKWQLQLEPYKTEDPGNILLYFSLWRIKTCERLFRVHVEFNVFHVNGELYASEGGLGHESVCVFPDSEPLKAKSHVTRSNRISASLGRVVFKDTLRMRCRLCIDGPLYQRIDFVDPVEAFKQDPYKNSKSRTAPNMKSRRQDLESGNVIVCSKTKTFVAHKAVLSGKFNC